MKNLFLLIALVSLSPIAAFGGPILASAAKAPIRDCKAPVECHPCLSYDFIDLEYGITDFSNPFLNDDAESLGVSFSKSLGEVLFLTGGYTNTDTDHLFGLGGSDLEVHQYTLGLGAHFSLAKCVDLTLEGGFDHRDFSSDGGGLRSFDSWGYYVGPGIRARSGRLEGFAKVFYVGREGVPALYNFDSDGWVFNPGVLYHLTDHLALKVDADLGEDYSTVNFGARIHF